MPATTRSRKNNLKDASEARETRQSKQPYQRPTVSPSISTSPPGLTQEFANTSRSKSPIFFWRETEPKTGWLSQWYFCDFTDPDGVVYHTAEHYMMYQKALLFSDHTTGAKILAASHPRQVKSLGRQVTPFDEQVWQAQREEIVRRGTIYKFTRAVSEDGLRCGVNSEAPLVAPLTLKGLLMATGEREIVETSPMDRIWGVGFGAVKAEANRHRWGKNLLGKVLMGVREEFRRKDEQGEDGEKEKE